MNFTEIAKLMNQMYSKTGKLPIGVKVNSSWFEKQIQQTFVLRKSNENPLEAMTGLPVHECDDIETFEFVYKE